MDNLDRTNVVQAALARWTLNQQLKAVGILSGEDSIEAYEGISKDFRESQSIPHPCLSSPLKFMF
jgi:hypothetical protein